MKPMDRWSALARRVRAHPEPPPAEMPFGFAARVLAGWKAAETDPPLDLEIVELLRRAAAAAAVVVLLSLALNLRALTSPIAVAESPDVLTAALFTE